MAVGSRPTACAATNKRMRRKSWYYRDGKFFYNKRAWEEAREKLDKEREEARAKKAEEKAQAKAAAAAPAEQAAQEAAAPETQVAAEQAESSTPEPKQE